MIYVLVLVTFYYIDGVHEEGSICQVREEDFDARFMKKLKSPWENIYSKTEVDELLNAKQNLLIEGTGIDIDEDDEISCTVEPSQVTVTQVQTTGTKIATIDVDGVDTDIYAPAASGGLAEDVIADEFDTTPTVVPPSGTLYQSGDKVYKDSGDRPTNNCYRCTANNTQSGTWDSSKWTQLTDVTEISSPGAQVDPGKVVIDRTTSKAYECIASWPAWFVTGNPDPSQFKQLPDYDTTAYNPGSTTYHQYSVGDFVMKDGELYKCKSSTTGQSWVASKWETTQVTDELGGGGSTVSVTQVVSTGTKIATITVDGNGTDLYAPASGGGGGATVIEVWAPPTEPGAQYRIIDSFADAKSRHLQVDFKVSGTNKTLSEVKALVEAGYCVLKTNSELSPIITVESSHGFVLVKGYGTNYDDSYIFSYSGGSWNCM